ncbi:MAG: dihydroxyacetone kinase subunit DhaK [Clostridia bacterium]|nr:dihydroxyacetone kinase subunit DhaK [Clostridia bacterium]
MKKIINAPEDFSSETVEGILYAHPDRLKALDGDLQILVRADDVKKGKVSIVTGGGSGHLPVFLGYVGKGMLDGCAVGNVFASPSANKMFKMIKGCDNGAGVLCLYGNYGGDNMNFDMACELSDMEDIKTMQIRVSDDVASATLQEKKKRRAVAGLVYAWKIAGAAADMMLPIEEVAEITRHALENLRSMGVALTPCIVPMAGKPTFSIGDDEMEVGMGIHGEPGIEVRKKMTANETVRVLMDKITEDMPLFAGNEVAVMVNGLGGTPLEELYICYREVFDYLARIGVVIYSKYIGEFATSMEMAGMSISILKMDDRLKMFLDYEANTPFFTNANR